MIYALLNVILQHSLLKKDGLICNMCGTWAKVMPISELACLAGVHYKAARRGMDDLVSLGYIEKERQIKRKNKTTQRLEVYPVARRLTLKFWEALGLKREYLKAVAWAKQHDLRKVFYKFKEVALNATKAVVSTGKSMPALLKKLAEKSSLEEKSKAVKPPSPGDKFSILSAEVQNELLKKYESFENIPAYAISCKFAKAKATQI